MTDKNGQFLATHDAVLGRLDWWQSKDGKLHYYPPDKFAQSINSFSTIPIVYAGKHPETGFKGRNLEDVLKNSGAKLAGYTQTAMINNMGSPKIFSKLGISDAEVNQKIENGELAISLGFWYTAPDVGALDNISGDHVLLYDRSLGIPQGDAGAMIINQDDGQTGTAYYGYLEGQFESEKMAENNEPKNELGEVLTLLKANQEQHVAGILEKEKIILKLNQDIEGKDAQILKLNQDLAGKDKEILALKTSIEGLEKKALEEKAAQFKANQDAFWNSTELSDGTREHFADRKAELCDPDKYLKLNQDILTYELKLRAGTLPDAEGDKHLKGNQGQDGEFDYAKINAAFNLATGGIQ